MNDAWASMRLSRCSRSEAGIASHCAAVEAKVLNEQLTQALNTRIVIEQAKGVLAERGGLDMEQSFIRLRGHARGHNLRLADVAQSIIDGTLSTDSLDPASAPRRT